LGVGRPLVCFVEEQYELAESTLLDTSTEVSEYEIKTLAPKQILVIAYDADHYVGVSETDMETRIIRADGSLTITGKGISKIYTKTVSGTGRLHISVWKR